MDDLLKRTQNTKQYHHPNQHVPLGVVIYPSLEVFFLHWLKHQECRQNLVLVILSCTTDHNIETGFL